MPTKGPQRAYNLQRILSMQTGTLSVLIDQETGAKLCYLIEPPYQKEKIPGKTRIPEGVYYLRLNTTGHMNVAYKKRFPSLHQGMIEIVGIPGFTNVYFHIGNYVADTEGCPLMCERAVCGVSTIKGTHSQNAYVASYTHLLDAMKTSHVTLHVMDG